MKKKVLFRTIAVIIVLGFVLGFTLPFAQVGAQDPPPWTEIKELRGRSHKVYWGETPSTYVVEFVGSPEFTRSTIDGSWVEYGFSDYGDFYAVQHPWYSVAFYDYYTVVYDETFTEVKIYDDRWIVEYQNRQGKWTNTGFWDVNRSYEIVEDGIKLKRTGSTTIGQREEIYYFRNGSPCKIEIRQDTDEAHTIRFVWKPSGIVADSERNIVVGEFDKHAGEVVGLNYYDKAGSFVYTLRWYDELSITEDIIPFAEGHARGRKVTVTFGNFVSSAVNTVILDPDTFYPDANVESSSVDGWIRQQWSSSHTWSETVAGTGDDASDFRDDELYAYASYMKASSSNNGWLRCGRMAILFNTAALPDDANITAVVLSLYGAGYMSDGLSCTPDIAIYSSAPASNTALVEGDFDSFGTTVFSNVITYGSWNDAAYNDFTFNADGRAAISKTGVSKFGARNANYDVADALDPGNHDPNWVSEATSQIVPRTAEQGGDERPKLVVTYTTPLTVTTQAATDVEDTTATGNGNITDIGAGNADYRGIAWDTTSRSDPGALSPADSDYASYSSEGPGSYGTGAFTRSLTSLATGTTHYARAYAHNSEGWNWGGEVSFLTKPAAPTSVNATDNIYTDLVRITWTKSTGATGYKVYEGANLLDTLGDVATYDDTNAPAGTISNAGTVTASDGSQTAYVVLNLASEATTNGASRTYKVVALNATGDSEDSSTNDGYRGVGSITHQWQRSAGDSAASYSNIGGGTTDPYDDIDAPAGVITPGTATASDGASEDHVTLSLAGESVVDGTGRYFQCIVSSVGASNSPQTSDNNRGYRTTGAITYQWQRSDVDSDADYGNIGGGTTDPYNDTGAPSDGSGRWYLVLLNATGTMQAESNHDRGYRGAAPTITTGTCTGFDLLWAIVNGYVDDEGSDTITQVGFDYGLTDAYGSEWTETGSWSTGNEFWTKLTGLSPATVFHYRAKAYNNLWGYGSDMVFSTSGSTSLYEVLNTGGDGDSDPVYSANWTAMQFTSDNTSHTVTSIRVPLKRVGTSPGTVTLSITHADSDNFSTGADLSFAELNGNAMTTSYVWYDFDIADVTLDGTSKYAIVVKALSGNSTDYILWQGDAGGALDDAVGSHSIDSGISWTSDTPTDYLFEVWGETVISIESAVVFSGYTETGDWLIVLTYKNTYTPYYPNDDPETYFHIQLIDDTTVKAQVNCPMWGYRPGSIYISKSLADTLEWGSANYKMRLQGDFGTNPATDYVLTDLDWKGAALIFLDRWVIAQANSIGDYYDIPLTVDIADLGEVLNAAGHTMFSIGIPELNIIRPNLFEMAVRQPGYGETEWTHALPGETNWEARLGPQVSGVLTEIGDLIGADGKGIGGALTFIAFMVVLCLLTLFGNVVVGLFLSYPILLMGAWFGVVDYVLLGVLTFAVAVVFIYKMFLIR